MFEKQPFSSQRYPVKQPSPNMDIFDLPPGDPFASETSSMVPIKKSVEIPHNFLGNPIQDKEPLVQMQTQEQVTVGGADLSPRPNFPEEDTQQMEEFGDDADARERIGLRLDAPIWKGPQRPGPLLWWQKRNSELSAETRWHRAHPLSPAFGVQDIDNSRKKDEPKKPSHGRSEPWYVEGE
jgi:hypothetical protein